ncbi:unnamed protein product [Rotaria socialis]|uniref:Uncharacterized protein n=1 Tax=Rotaria socialis TaxID=392032 RepID=A0A819ZSQ7_9BILA|nr:unnamed protein product [Rotaria socialis]CAF4349215.1 unnamed protein product [Rotaria socialis]CAF4429235.1 unnamed protein product [Rotaria socialis]CAF4741175.1 unnamed protein product [Rotaria socialis]
MDQRILSQFLHRVGFTSIREAICDGCECKFNDGDMGFRCMECSGFVLPGNKESNQPTNIIDNDNKQINDNINKNQLELTPIQSNSNNS